MQQLLSKKNHYTFGIDDRSLKTGDVKGHDKTGSLSDVESLSLAAIGAEKAIAEFMGPRGDNMTNKNEMYRQIARDGYCSLYDMTEDKSAATTLNTINTYLLASGIRSDLINDTMKTEFTIKQDLKNK